MSASPEHDPRPAELLRLTIVDPATGSGHFLVEACRYVGEALLTACQLCDERGLHDRIAALPDPDNTIAPYLPSRNNARDAGFSASRARAICRRLVAVHCLYGCDRNKLAIELAKLSLWLESYAEGLPLTFLDQRLIHGDALTGPFFESLLTLPVTGGSLDALLASGVGERLAAGLRVARQRAAELNATIGRDLPDLILKQMARDRIDIVLEPLRNLAKAWAGAAMTQDRDSDDVWLQLAGHVAESGNWPARLTSRQEILLEAGSLAIAWDLTFPEIFPTGFSVVLGNPPWNVVQHNKSDFAATLEPSARTASAPGRHTSTPQPFFRQADVEAAFQAYRTGFERQKRIAARLYQHQRVRVGDRSTAGNLDLFRLFAERNLRLAAMDGAIGVLMPSAFHANEGATGIRQLYFKQTDVAWCLSFENRRRLFDIDSRFKFDLIVARRPGPTRSFRCAFYLQDLDQASDPSRVMTYTMQFLEASGSASLTPPELRGQADLAIAERFFAEPLRLGRWCETHGVRLGRDLHMTDDAGAFQPIRPQGRGASSAPAGMRLLHEGKTFHQYTDLCDTLPRYMVSVDALQSKPLIADRSQYYRLAFRDIARSNDNRTMIACMAPPGVVFGHTATVERAPGGRADADALILCAVFNAFPFDWLIRQKAATHLSLYLLNALPVPVLNDTARRFLAHGSLRLSCNHSEFDTLWRGQLGNRPHEPPPRSALRAQLDAVVADAYDLTYNHYEHVLGSFSHRTDPDAVSHCLAELTALRAEGLASFCLRRDPFSSVELVTTRARPVLLPIGQGYECAV